MPGPVSDSFDPEFGTGASAADVQEAINKIVKRVEKTANLKERKNIVEVVNGKCGTTFSLQFSERDCHVLRFALERALETI